jgi:hypothetical protein
MHRGFYWKKTGNVTSFPKTRHGREHNFKIYDKEVEGRDVTGFIRSV